MPRCSKIYSILRLPLSLIVVSLLLVIWPSAKTAAQEPDFENAKVTAVKVGDGVYMLACMGTNIGLWFGKTSALIVDSCWSQLSDKLRQAISDQTNQTLTYVVNTHWHGDHTGGNESFGKAGAIIVAHTNTRERLRVNTSRWPSGKVLKASPSIALPVMTFTREMTLYEDEEQIDFISVPNAHTDGDIIVVFRKANVIHAGDIFITGSYPSVEYDKGGSLSGMIDAVNLLIELSDDDTKIIPGHLDLADKTDVLRYRDMLLLIKSRVMAGQASGKPLEELLAENPLKDLENDWGSGRGPLFRKGNDVYERIFVEERFSQ